MRLEQTDLEQTDLEQYLEPRPGERPRSQSTSQAGTAAPPDAWLYDDQVCLLREARSLLRSVLHDVQTLRSRRNLGERRTPFTKRLGKLDSLLEQVDRELRELNRLRCAELERP